MTSDPITLEGATVSEKRELDEPILPDDYPIYGDYLYVVDGKVIASDWHDITVARLKLAMKAKEVRRCDMVGRQQIIDAAIKAGDELLATLEAERRSS